MKRLSFVIAVGIFSAACSRHSDPSHMGALPGAPTGTTTSTKYGGAIAPKPANAGQTYFQTITVNADVITHDGDQVEAYLCRNQECSTGNLPVVSCAAVFNQPTAACYTTTPNYQIAFGHGSVSFINANDSDYSSYYIKTTITR